MYQRSWLRERPETQYLFLPPEAENAYEQDLVRIAALRPPLQTLLRRSRDPRDVVRAIEQVVRAGAVRRRGGRAIIKDPFALLMAEWIDARTAADVIVCVRHPAAFASSIKRLGWRLDERWLLSQDGLMADELAPHCPGRTGSTSSITPAWRGVSSTAWSSDCRPTTPTGR